MKNIWLLAITIMFASTVSFAQSTGNKLDKLSKDPLTKEKAAKADVLIINKQKLFDSSITAEKPNTFSATEKKKRKCFSKRKN